MFKIQKINNMPLPSLSPFLAFDQFTIYFFINELKNTFFSIIFAWPIYGFVKPSAKKGLIFLKSVKGEEQEPGGREGERRSREHGEAILWLWK